MFRFELMELSLLALTDYREFWKKMQDESRVEIVFPEGKIQTLEDLCNFWQTCWVYFGYQEGKLVGAVWFSNHSPDECYINFISFKGFKMTAEAREQIEALIDGIFDNSLKMEYKIKGRTPYLGLIRIFCRWGFRKNGMLKEAMYDAFHSEWVTLYDCIMKKSERVQ